MQIIPLPPDTQPSYGDDLVSADNEGKCPDAMQSNSFLFLLQPNGFTRKALIEVRCVGLLARGARPQPVR